MTRLTRDGTAEPVSRDQILRRERGHRNINFPGSADHDEDWQPYPFDPYSCYMCDRIYIQYNTETLIQLTATEEGPRVNDNSSYSACWLYSFRMNRCPFMTSLV